MPEADPPRDHYAVLGVAPSASPGEITAAYRGLVRSLHPDARPSRPGARREFEDVVAAYAVLRDPARRAAYDARRRGRTRGGVRVSVRVTRRTAADRPARPGGPRPPLVDLTVAGRAGPAGPGRGDDPLEGVTLLDLLRWLRDAARRR
ncbi:hypothetical protein GCM10027168_50430 [Streptomyces capparidis]